VLGEWGRIVAEGRLRGEMDGMRVDLSGQIQMVMELLTLRMLAPPVVDRFRQCVVEFEAGLGCATARCEADILAAYRRAHEGYYAPLMERLPHVMENWLINYVFRTGYPFGWAREEEENWAGGVSEHGSMLVQAGLVQAVLIGMAGYKREEFGVGDVVRLVQSMAKTVEHSRMFLDQIMGFVRDREVGGILRVGGGHRS
jgi:lysine-N-methylase